MVDRPDEDATSAEIAEWMAEDFGEALVEGAQKGLEEKQADENDE
jgi:hypothetical protein